MNQATIRPLQRKVLRDSVYESLVDLLMSGEIAPGSALGIDALAAQLGVSPTPVREALVHLERTGLVTRAAMRGYRVAPPLDADMIGQLCDARIVIEVGALELAFTRAADLAPALAKAHAAHERAAEQVVDAQPTKQGLVAYRRYLDADWAFHRTIHQFTGNSYLIASTDNLPAHLHQLRQSATSGIRDVQRAVAEHAAVLAAVEQQDRPAALAALRHHLEQVKLRSLGGAGQAAG